MDHPGPVIAGGVLLLLITALLMPGLGTEFLPHLDEGNLWIRATMPNTISYTEASHIVPKLRDIMAKYRAGKTRRLAAWPTR